MSKGKTKGEGVAKRYRSFDREGNPIWVSVPTDDEATCLDCGEAVAERYDVCAACAGGGRS